MSPLLGLLLVYVAALVGLGLWIGRRVDRAGDFFVAGRRLGPGLLFATFLAANIGAGSTVGAAGLGYRDGLAAWWWVGAAGVGTLVLACWVGPRIWRLAREHDFHTVGDYLETRYGPSVRVVIAGLLWIGSLAILAGQLIALAWILEVVAGVPKTVGCLIGGGAMTIYFAAGGLLTSAWVNLVQLVVLLVGFVLSLGWVAGHAGGWSALAAAAPTRDYFHFWRGGESGCVHYLALLAPAFVASPGLVQKAFGARDERAIRVGVGLSAVALMAFALLPPLLGMATRIWAPGLANREHALPTLLASVLPPAVGGIGLAAILSAEMSSADAILFMLSTSIAKDFYRRFLRPAASDAETLRVARLAALGAGVLGVGAAILLPSVIASLTVFYSLLSVSLFVPLVAGLYSRRAGTPEALAAIGGGVVLLVATRVGLVGGGLGAWAPTTFGLVASALAFGVVWAVRRGR